MSIRSRLFALPMPGFVRRVVLTRLFRLTAEAFGAVFPGAHGQSVEDCLERYAAFAAAQADTLLRTGSPSERAAVEAGLFSRARQAGGRLRALLGIRPGRGAVSLEAMSVARALYRMMGVDFQCRAAGRMENTATPARFVVKSCFFSTRYSPGACRVISSLDAGLLSGLTGGGRLAFTHRMTEGASFCEGVIS